MRRNLSSENSILFFRGKFTVNLKLANICMFGNYEEVCSFEVVGFFGQFFNCISAVTKNTFQSVDISDFACYGGGVHVCGIEDTETSGSVILITFLPVRRFVNCGNTLFSYGAASFLKAVAGIELFWIGTSIV